MWGTVLNPKSIKWKIQNSLILFSVSLLIILWVFQVVLLEPFYRNIKTREVEKLAYTVKEQYNNPSRKNPVTINRETYVLIADANGNIIDDSSFGVSLKNPVFSSFELQYIFNQLGSSGKSISFDYSNATRSASDITYALKLDDSSMVLVQTQVVPVNATINTIKVQLVLVSVILIFISYLLTKYLYKKISKPIIEINDGAKVLANGNYIEPFHGKGYTEIEELSDTLNKMRIELSNIEKLRNELLANVGHDLKTPLTMIGGYAEMMKDLPDEMTENNLQIIIKETHKLSKLVEDMLDLSKIQSGMMQLDIQKINLSQQIASITSRLQQTYPNRLIELDIPDEIIVSVDESKFEQVLYNLMNNALIHTDSNLCIKAKSKANFIQLEVIDYGEGIPESEFESIWHRYYQSNNDHQRDQYGSGLGLSIVKNILDLHKFEYGVKSSDPHGTTFWIRIPI